MRRSLTIVILLIEVILLIVSQITGIDDAINSVLEGRLHDVVLGFDGLDIAIIALATILSALILFPNQD